MCTRLTPLLIILVCMLAACSSRKAKQQPIASTTAFYTEADSICRNGHGVRPSKMLESMPDTSPALISDIPVADWAFALEILHPQPSSARQIWIDHALLYPEEAAKRLLAIDPDSDPYWGLAAWEVFCATANRQWLEQAFNKLQASLLRRIGRRNLTKTDLFCTPASTVQPLELNTLMVAQAKCAVEMARQLGRTPNPDATLPRLARSLPLDINEALWHPSTSTYLSALCSYPYSLPVPTRSPGQTALAIMLDVATPDMARMAMARTPATPLGIPSVYPTSSPTPPADPATQYAWAAAAAKLGHKGHLDFALGALLANLAENPDQSLGAAIALRIFAGIRLLPNGLVFQPCVPEAFPGVKRIRGLRWRDCLLDISISGTGNKVTSLMVDGHPGSPVHVTDLPPGRHTIDILLAGNSLGNSDDGPEVIAAFPTLIPTPAPLWDSPRTASVSRGQYNVWINGVIEQQIQASDISLAEQPDRLLQVNITAIDATASSMPSASHLILPPGLALDFALEGDSAIAVNANATQVMIAQVCYRPSQREGAIQVAVNDSLQTVFSAFSALADSVWSVPAPLLLSPGLNRISFSQHSSSFNQLLHFRLIPHP